VIERHMRDAIEAAAAVAETLPCGTHDPYNHACAIAYEIRRTLLGK
jgi:hypothetical protein